MLAESSSPTIALAYAVAALQQPGETLSNGDHENAVQVAQLSLLENTAIVTHDSSQSASHSKQEGIMPGLESSLSTTARDDEKASGVARTGKNTTEKVASSSPSATKKNPNPIPPLAPQTATTTVNLVAEKTLVASIPTCAMETASSAASAAGEEEEEEDDDDQEDVASAERRLARSRERNREHARKTRQRKKAQLEALQQRVRVLEAERRVLSQSIEECGIASILLGLSSNSSSGNNNNNSNSGDRPTGNEQKIPEATANAATTTVTTSASWTQALLSGGKRRRFVSQVMSASKEPPVDLPPPPQQLTVCVDGETTIIGGGNSSHINWKTGTYHDEHGAQRQLTPEQLEHLRRERNRMHAKMTRDRKKCFIAAVVKTIEQLEQENERMRNILASVASTDQSTTTKPLVSPELGSTDGPHLSDDDLGAPTSKGDENTEPPKKRPCTHGFSLDG